MNRIKKQLPLMMLFVVMVFICKVDANAQADIISDVIWNTTGDKRPDNLTVEGYSNDYVVKYWTGTQWGLCGFETFSSWNSKHQLTNITYEVEYNYDTIDEMATLVNQERAKVGAAPLTVTDDMTRIAMQRAAETALYWSHTRPNGMSCTSLSCLEDQENIAADVGWSYDPDEDASCYAFFDVLRNSPGHYANMINTKWAYAGYGIVTITIDKYTKATYCVQVFADGKADYYPDGYPDNPYDWENATYTKKDKYKATVTVPICADYLTVSGWVGKDMDGYMERNVTMVVGEEKSNTEYAFQTQATTTQNVTATVSLTPDQYTMESLNSCLKIENGVIKAVKAGTGKVKFTLKANKAFTYTAEIKVQEKTVKTGSKVEVFGNTYKVTSTKSKTVSFYSGKINAATVTVPKTVKIQGKIYKVTSIAANAFKNNKKLTRVTIGANVTKLGSKAFYGCSKLKKITVKTTKLKSVGKNALKGIHKKAVIKVPKSKLTKYKKLFKSRGQKKTVTIKK